MSNAASDKWMYPGMIMPNPTPCEMASGWLAELEKLYATRDAVHAEKAVAVGEAIPGEVKRALEAIDREYAEQIQDMLFSIQAAEHQVKTRVAALHASVKGSTLHAVYNAGRVTWDEQFAEFMEGEPR